MVSVNLSGITNGNIGGTADFSTPPVDAIQTEKIVNIAGTQFHPLIVDKPDVYSYFIVRVPTELLNALHLHDLPTETVFNIASNLSLKDLKSLGRVFRSSKNYTQFMGTLYKTYCHLLKPKILPLCNQGTFIYSGAATGNVFFKGFDRVGIKASKEDPIIESYEIPSLAQRNIKSVFRCQADFDGSRYYILVHTEEGDVFVFYSNRRRGSVLHPTFEKINKNPVIEVVCKDRHFYLRTADSIFRYEEGVNDTWNVKFLYDSKLDNMEQVVIGSNILAVKYKDGSAKILSGSSYKEIANFKSVEKFWHCGDYIIILSDDRFFRISDYAENINLMEFPSLQGKKVVAVSPSGRFVCTEKDGWWGSGHNTGGCLGLGNNASLNGYIQITTLNNISRALEIDNQSSLFLADGKLYYAGGGNSRKLVDDNPQWEYHLPTECIRTMGYSIENIWCNGTNIWFEGEDGVYQLTTDSAFTSWRRPFDLVPMLHFTDFSSIPTTCQMLEVWNQIYDQHKNRYKGENARKQDESGLEHWRRIEELIGQFDFERKEQFSTVRHMIITCKRLEELKQKIETIAEPFPEVIDFLEFLKKEVELKKEKRN